MNTLAHLRVIESDSGEVWDNLLVTVQFQVLVNGCANCGFDGVLKLSDDHWDESALEKWDEDGSDLGNQSSRKGNIDIIWVDINIDLANGNHWSKLGGWGSRLSRHIELSIKVEFLDGYCGLSVDGDDVFEGEVSVQLSLDSIGKKLETIVLRIEVNVDVFGIWLGNLNFDVLELSSVEINLWNLKIFDILKDVWGDNVLSSADSFLVERTTKAWSVCGRHS